MIFVRHFFQESYLKKLKKQKIKKDKKNKIAFFCEKNLKINFLEFCPQLQRFLKFEILKKLERDEVIKGWKFFQKNYLFFFPFELKSFFDNWNNKAMNITAKT